MKLRGNIGWWGREEIGKEGMEGRFNQNHIICLCKILKKKKKKKPCRKINDKSPNPRKSRPQRLHIPSHETCRLTPWAGKHGQLAGSPRSNRMWHFLFLNFEATSVWFQEGKALQRQGHQGPGPAHVKFLGPMHYEDKSQVANGKLWFINAGSQKRAAITSFSFPA